MDFTHNFGLVYYYPSQGEPEFEVSSIEGGYKFSFPKDTNSSFSISANVVENLKQATTYEGKQGEAIELFRKHLAKK